MKFNDSIHVVTALALSLAVLTKAQETAQPAFAPTPMPTSSSSCFLFCDEKILIDIACVVGGFTFAALATIGILRLVRKMREAEEQLSDEESLNDSQHSAGGDIENRNAPLNSDSTVAAEAVVIELPLRRSTPSITRLTCTGSQGMFYHMRESQRNASSRTDIPLADAHVIPDRGRRSQDKESGYTSEYGASYC